MGSAFILSIFFAIRYLEEERGRGRRKLQFLIKLLFLSYKKGTRYKVEVINKSGIIKLLIACLN